MIDGIVDTINSNVSANKTTLSTINTNCSNLNSRLTNTRAGYLDYLANSTYGLNAIKTAINNLASNSGGLKSVTKTYSSLASGSYYNTGLTELQLVNLHAIRTVSGGINPNWPVISELFIIKGTSMITKSFSFEVTGNVNGSSTASVSISLRFSDLTLMPSKQIDSLVLTYYYWQ